MSAPKKKKKEFVPVIGRLLVDRAWCSVSDFFFLSDHCSLVHSASDLIIADKQMAFDPYCIVSVALSNKRSKTLLKTNNPKWEEKFTLYVCDSTICWNPCTHE